MRVEDFGNADIVMIDACLAEQEQPMVCVQVTGDDLYRALRGFEEYLRQAAEVLRLAVAASNSPAQSSR